jgi:hypothetical protein
MLLEAQSAGCFSSRYLLRLDGHPHGECSTRWFGEGLDVRLLQQRQLVFEKEGLFSGRFLLVDCTTGQPLTAAGRSSIFTRNWDLHLSAGAAVMQSAGFFTNAYDVVQGEYKIAAVDRTGICSTDWFVESYTPLSDIDLLTIGLVYHTVLRRQGRQHAGPPGGIAGAGAAGS